MMKFWFSICLLTSIILGILSALNIIEIAFWGIFIPVGIFTLMYLIALIMGLIFSNICLSIFNRNSKRMVNDFKKNNVMFNKPDPMLSVQDFNSRFFK